eukprot:c7578_g1_i1.p1 GENE.c7578_g1_i1~~c7578_g1_i1.p1  ORF type:complete len:477 (+),score=196.71 c7578_g1_i1:1-1431(+)
MEGNGQKYVMEKPSLQFENEQKNIKSDNLDELQPLLETRQEKGTETETKLYSRPSTFMLILVLATNFGIGTEYAILMPTVWQYVKSVGGSQFYLGLVLAAFSVSRTIFFYVFGRWTDKRNMKEPFVCSFIIGFIGNVMYGIAGRFDSKELILGGRIVAGLGAANSTLVQHFIAKNYRSEERTKYLSIFQATAMMSVLAGPAINIALVALDDQNLELDGFVFDSETAAGYLMAFLNLVLFFLYLIFFEDSAEDLEQKEFQIQSSSRPELYGWGESLKIVLIDRAGWFPMLVNFVTAFGITSLETLVTPLTSDQYGWGTEENSYLFCGLCGVGVLAVISTVILDKRPWMSLRGIIVISSISTLFAIGVGIVFCGQTKVPLVGLLTFGGFFAYGLVMQASPSLSIYSYLIGEFEKGVFMSYSQTSIGIARIAGPLIGGTMLDWGSYYYVFSFLGFVCALPPLLLPFVWKKMYVPKGVKG